MKYTQRLDYGRLAEVLNERGLAGLDAIRELLQLSQDGGMPFCEALVTSSLVSDWDLSKVVCETFQLPFLPVDLVTPNPDALEDLDHKLFQEHQLVPVDVFGQVLTVAMPALVTAEVLAHVSAASDYLILPMVGTVESNRRWITEHLSLGPAPELEGGWESMFDAADAELTGLTGNDDDDAESEDSDSVTILPPPLDEEVEDSLDVVGADLDLDDLDLGEIEALSADDLETEPLMDEDLGDGEMSEDKQAGDAESPILPPMPEFGQRDAS